MPPNLPSRALRTPHLLSLALCSVLTSCDGASTERSDSGGEPTVRRNIDSGSLEHRGIDYAHLCLGNPWGRDDPPALELHAMESLYGSYDAYDIPVDKALTLYAAWSVGNGDVVDLRGECTVVRQGNQLVVTGEASWKERHPDVSDWDHGFYVTCPVPPLEPGEYEIVRGDRRVPFKVPSMPISCPVWPAME